MWSNWSKSISWTTSAPTQLSTLDTFRLGCVREITQQRGSVEHSWVSIEWALPHYSPLGLLNLGTTDIGGGTILCRGGILCTVGCLVASLSSLPQTPGATPLLWQPKMTPEIAKCPLRVRGQNHPRLRALDSDNAKLFVSPIKKSKQDFFFLSFPFYFFLFFFLIYLFIYFLRVTLCTK